MKTATDKYASKSDIKYARMHLPFLNSMKRYLESSTPESIRAQLESVNKKITIHKRRIAESTERMQPPAAKAWTVQYEKSVGMPRLREYQKTLTFIVDD